MRPPRRSPAAPRRARRPLLAAAATAAALLAPLPLRADEVHLGGGTRLTGVVVARDDAGLTLLLPGGDEVRLAAADVAKVVPDDGAPKGERTVRFVDRGAEGASLQVAVVHLVAPAGGPRVDLVGAVHIGDRAYFREAQALLERADVVLFEMVKPKDVAPDAMDEGPPNPIREFQGKLAKALDLAFQLDEVDYDRPHFVHADLTTEEMAGGPAGGGEGASGADRPPALPERLRAILPLIAMMNPVLDRLIASPQGAERLQLKRMLASTMASLGPRAGALMGAELSELLLDRRNAVVVERLKELPPGARTVAVFYGAAHLADLEERIVEQLGYRRAGARWMDAWRIAAPGRREAARPEPAREPAPAGAR